MRLERLYPVKSKPRASFRYSTSASNCGSAWVTAASERRGCLVSTMPPYRPEAAAPRVPRRVRSVRPFGVDRLGVQVTETPDQVADQPRRAFRLLGELAEVCRRRGVAAVPGGRVHPAGEGGLLLQAAQRHPQRALERGRLLLQQALRRPGVADPAAVPRGGLAGQLEQGAVATRAGQPRWLGREIPGGEVLQVGHRGLQCRQIGYRSAA